MKRLVPNLVLNEHGAWVTKHFEKAVYLGEPSNVVRIMNELLADELSITWIGTDIRARDTTLELISSQASMPLSYCGAIENVKEALRISSIGFERIGLTSSYLRDPLIARKIADELGRSSVSLRIPVTGTALEPKIWLWREKMESHQNLAKFLNEVSIDNVGEVVLTSVKRNGAKTGSQPELVTALTQLSGVQRGYEGGVSSPSEVAHLWQSGVDAVYASSFLFLYGEFDAPLPDYPSFQLERYMT